MTDAVVIDVSPSALTLKEVMDLEDASGVPLSQIATDLIHGTYTARQLAAYVWIVKRREDPDFTFEQATELKYGAITFGGEEESPPAEAAEGGSGKKR